MKSKVVIFILIVLIAIRAALPAVLLPQINSFLADFSKVYVLHIEDLDLSILRGAYRFEGVVGSLRGQDVHFITANYIDLSLSWRELFRGEILADMVADQVKFVLTSDLIEGAKAQTAKETLEEGKKAKEKLIPFNISRIDLRNSDFQVTRLEGLPSELQLEMNSLEGRLNNVTPTAKDPISLFVGKGSLMNSGEIKIVGELNQRAKPLDWNFDVELKNFEAAKLNGFLKQKLPLTFDTGVLDGYVEVKSENGRVEGYVKPFLKNAHFLGDEQDFKGVKHFGIEISVATLNALLKSSADKSVATRFIFSFDDKDGFQWNASHAISTALAHGFQDKLHPGLENIYALKLPKPDEVQSE